MIVVVVVVHSDSQATPHAPVPQQVALLCKVRVLSIGCHLLTKYFKG